MARVAFWSNWSCTQPDTTTWIMSGPICPGVKRSSPACTAWKRPMRLRRCKVLLLCIMRMNGSFTTERCRLATARTASHRLFEVAPSVIHRISGRRGKTSALPRDKPTRNLESFDLLGQAYGSLFEVSYNHARTRFQPRGCTALAVARLAIEALFCRTTEWLARLLRWWLAGGASRWMVDHRSGMGCGGSAVGSNSKSKAICELRRRTA
mmetsp:Transcript_21968/g.50305  ORF Transcript_21968/g.50305 Transcript_21968/m.50305 type:complete len:209 (-) Transcript_21968:41-667(-)